MRDFPLAIDIEGIDFMGHVNKFDLSRIDADSGHRTWQRAASPAAVATYVWIALSREIAYRKPRCPSDRLTASVVAAAGPPVKRVL